MFETPSIRSRHRQGIEWDYLRELDAMATWLCSGDDASPALAEATASMDTFRGPAMVRRWIHGLTTFEVERATGEAAAFADYLDRLVEGSPARRPDAGSALRAEVEDRLAVIESLCDLPDNYRCALLLKEGYGLSVEKTAWLLGATMASARSVLYRARQQLR